MDTTPSIWREMLPIVPIVLAILACGYFYLRYLRRRRLKYPPRVSRPLPKEPLPHFVFARIMDRISPMDRSSKYGDPLDDSLRQFNAGFVTGGGTQLDKAGAVMWIGIDIELRDLDSSLELTRKRLQELGAPPGSVLEYKIGGENKTLPIVT
jgi:hypothetical protein